MADTIAVMNRGQDRAARHRRPSSTSGRGPRSSPTSSAPRTCSTAPSTSPGTIRLGDGTRGRGRGGIGDAARSPWASAPRRSSSGRRLQNRLDGTVKECAYIGVATQVVVTTAVGDLTVFHQNSETGGLVPAPGETVDHQLAGRRQLRRRRRGGELRMTTQFTRRQIVQRGAAGITILSLPGLLAACGGGGGGGERRASSRTSSTSRTGRSTSTSTRRPRSVRRSTRSPRQTGIKVNYFEDINSNAEYFGKIQGPLSQGRGIDRDIIVLTDN